MGIELENKTMKKDETGEKDDNTEKHHTSVFIVQNADIDKGVTSYNMTEERQPKWTDLLLKQRPRIIIGTKLLIVTLFLVYCGYSFTVRFGDEGSIRLLVCTVLGLSLVFWRLLKRRTRIKTAFKTITGKLSSKRLRKTIRWVLYIGSAVFMIGYTTVTVAIDYPENLVSLVGIVSFLFLLYAFSTDKSKVKWHTVYWGMMLQFIFAVVVLSSTWGVEAIHWVSERIEEITSYSKGGSKFVFGENYETVRFAFKSMPTVLTFIAFLNVMAYLGVTTFLVRNIGGFLSVTLGTSPVESVVAAANIFIGTNGSLMFVREYLDSVSISELHCMIVAGMASLAGPAMVIYMSFGIPTEYLLAASILSAPASLACAKLCMPEKQDKGNVKRQEDFRLSTDEKKANNMLEAIALGAFHGAKVITRIVVSIIVFIALGSFINATLTWFGDRINIKGLTFETISSYVFWPVSFVMGIPYVDCGAIAEQIGVRLITNALIAYINIGKLIRNRQTFVEYAAFHNDTVFQANGDIFLPGLNTTLEKGIIQARTEVIGVYALCGFASLPTMGIILGVVGALAPTRFTDVTQIIMRAFVVSMIASFLTACVAGLLFVE